MYSTVDRSILKSSYFCRGGVGKYDMLSVMCLEHVFQLRGDPRGSLM